MAMAISQCQWRHHCTVTLGRFLFVSETSVAKGDTTGKPKKRRVRCQRFFIDLLMGLFRGAVFHHGGVPENCPLKLMGLFPSLKGRFPTLMVRFPECLSGPFSLLKISWKAVRGLRKGALIESAQRGTRSKGHRWKIVKKCLVKVLVDNSSRQFSRSANSTSRFWQKVSEKFKSTILVQFSRAAPFSGPFCRCRLKETI